MAKVITFSRVFPAHHPKKGQPTHFVEKVWANLVDQQKQLPEFWSEWFMFNHLYDFDHGGFSDYKPKHHKEPASDLFTRNQQ
ncbi:MAG: hypothetical protein ACRCYO_13510 [Bacteroidia bacterium]